MYRAKIEIDGDRWCKHPYAIKIYDDEGNTIKLSTFLDDREHCYRISRQYGIDDSDVDEEVY